jgi:hypothetical protein
MIDSFLFGMNDYDYSEKQTVEHHMKTHREKLPGSMHETMFRNGLYHGNIKIGLPASLFE